MKIKDLPRNASLGGVRFRYPGDGKLYYWHSQWNRGVWGKLTLDSDRAIPLFVGDLTETMEWEVVPLETVNPA